jgi:hypothetical protein
MLPDFVARRSCQMLFANGSRGRQGRGRLLGSDEKAGVNLRFREISLRSFLNGQRRLSDIAHKAGLLHLTVDGVRAC